jgi:hypothetical protein
VSKCLPTIFRDATNTPNQQHLTYLQLVLCHILNESFCNIWGLLKAECGGRNFLRDQDRIQHGAKGLPACSAQSNPSYRTGCLVSVVTSGLEHVAGGPEPGPSPKRFIMN